MQCFSFVFVTRHDFSHRMAIRRLPLRTRGFWKRAPYQGTLCRNDKLLPLLAIIPAFSAGYNANNHYFKRDKFKEIVPKKFEFGAEVRKVTLSGSDHNLAFIGKYLNRGRIQMVNIKGCNVVKSFC